MSTRKNGMVVALMHTKFKFEREDPYVFKENNSVHSCKRYGILSRGNLGECPKDAATASLRYNNRY